jgi:hypothetical protein
MPAAPTLRPFALAPQRLVLVAAVVVSATLLAPRPARATPGCALDSGGSCVCEDSMGQQWDLTGLTDSSRGSTQVVATGGCSGTYCQGGFQYFIDICGQLDQVVSCYSGICCTSTMSSNMFRLDQRYDCPPSSLCQ